MRRTLVSLAAVASLALPAVFMVGGAAPASASSGVVCKKLTGTAGGSITIKSCTPKDKQHKSATGSSATLTNGGPITWSPAGDQTVISAPATTVVGQGLCKKGSTEIDATAQVTGGNSSYTQVGDQISGKICLSSKGKVSLVKGTTFTL
jgi:hypothetical protein